MCYSRLLSAQRAFAVSLNLLAALHGFDDMLSPKFGLDHFSEVPHHYGRVKASSANYQESCCSPWTYMLGIWSQIAYFFYIMTLATPSVLFWFVVKSDRKVEDP